jgi:hypothetical protein
MILKGSIRKGENNQKRIGSGSSPIRTKSRVAISFWISLAVGSENKQDVCCQKNRFYKGHFPCDMAAKSKLNDSLMMLSNAPLSIMVLGYGGSIYSAPMP